MPCAPVTCESSTVQTSAAMVTKLLDDMGTMVASTALRVSECPGPTREHAPVYPPRGASYKEITPMPSEMCPLTSAQVEFMEFCLSRGKSSDKEIAALLFLSPLTIRTRFREICSVLGVHGRADAFLLAFNEGWIKSPSGDPSA